MRNHPEHTRQLIAPFAIKHTGTFWQRQNQVAFSREHPNLAIFGHKHLTVVCRQAVIDFGKTAGMSVVGTVGVAWHRDAEISANLRAADFVKNPVDTAFDVIDHGLKWLKYTIYQINEMAMYTANCIANRVLDLAKNVLPNLEHVAQTTARHVIQLVVHIRKDLAVELKHVLCSTFGVFA